MTAVFIASLIGGLLLAVRIMMLGVERPPEGGPSGERSFRLSPPLIVAFTVVFGVAGYLIIKRTTAGPLGAVTIAAILGGLAAVVTARLVRRWWTITPEHDVDDERYVLQGQVARVITPIGAGTDGEVAFDFGTERRVVRARSVGDVTMSAGTEVVIERIEDDVAFVEPWLEVEKRL
jgi:membrane protein implicated in regulation of membrane protease activity